jgi:hypothetical protein
MKPTAKEHQVLQRIAQHGGQLVVTRRAAAPTTYTFIDGSGAIPSEVVRPLVKKRLLVPGARGLFDFEPQSYRIRRPEDGK